MKQLLSLMIILLLCACGEVEQLPDTPQGNFDALVKIIDEHYCYLDEKGIDWASTAARYRPQVTSATSQRELFDICSSLLAELKDGHVNLASRFDTFYYRAWWSDYPQDFNLRTLQQYYLGFDYSTVSGMNYKVLTPAPDVKIGYIYLGSFSSAIGEAALSYVLASFHDCKGVIIDIRNNGGGLLTSVETMVRRFIQAPVTVGYIYHKTGPGHSEFSKPYPVTYTPAGKGQISWAGPVVLLTNRACFSAANDFTMAMKALGQVTVIGAHTGGGGGMPFSAGLPNGWNLRFSACPMTDAEGNSVEAGIPPDIEVHAPDEALARGRDAILDYALEYLENK